MIRASHILVPTLKEAVELQNKITAGAVFEDLAKTYSLCPSGKSNGGDLGTFPKGVMVKPFEEAAFATPVGSISGPVQTQFGYHLIKRTA